MRFSLRLAAATAAAIALAPAPSLSAQTFANRATGLSNPGTAITFDEPTTVLGDAAGQFTSLGVSFTNLAVSATDFFGSGNSATTVDAPAAPGPVSITFTTAVSSFAFQYATNTLPQPSIFTAYLDGSAVATFSAFAQLNTSEWFGFENVLLDAVTVEPPFDQGLAIDNEQFTQVTPTPEPATVALLATGLVGVAGVARRWKKATAT
jgi:hypothetical protein